MPTYVSDAYYPYCIYTCIYYTLTEKLCTHHTEMCDKEESCHWSCCAKHQDWRKIKEKKEKKKSKQHHNWDVQSKTQMLPEKQMHTGREIECNSIQFAQALRRTYQTSPPRWSRKQGANYRRTTKLRKETHWKPLEWSFPPESPAASQGRQPYCPASPVPGCVTDPYSTSLPPALHSSSFHLQQTLSFFPSKLPGGFSPQGKESQGVTRASPSLHKVATPLFKKAGANSPSAVTASKTASPLDLSHKKEQTKHWCLFVLTFYVH